MVHVCYVMLWYVYVMFCFRTCIICYVIVHVCYVMLWYVYVMFCYGTCIICCAVVTISIQTFMHARVLLHIV